MCGRQGQTRLGVHAEVLTKDTVIWLAGFATLEVAKKTAANGRSPRSGKETKSRRTTCRISGKGEMQNGERALERVLMLINSITNHCKRERDTAQGGGGEGGSDTHETKRSGLSR